MKTHLLDNDFEALMASLARRYALPFISALLVSQPAFGDTTPREYILFLASDLMVSNGSEYSPVIGLDRGAVLVANEGVMEAMRTKEIQGIRMDRELRLSAARVIIGDHSAEPVYSIQRDPEMQAMQTRMTLQDYHSDAQDRAIGELNRAQQAHGLLRTQDASPADIAKSEQALADAHTNVTESSFELDRISQQTSLILPDSEQLHDSIQASFEVSSTDLIQDAYAMLAVWYRLPQDSGNLHLKTCFKEIGQIDDRRKTVDIRESGLPPGYKLDRYTIHVFSKGRELPSTLSPKTVSVSEAEAYQFLLLQHTTQNRYSTVSATPAWPVLGQNPLAHLSPEQVAEPVYVLVDEAGRVVDVTDDSSGKQRTDAAIRDLLREQQFFPAIENGKPVIQRVEIRLAEWRA